MFCTVEKISGIIICDGSDEWRWAGSGYAQLHEAHRGADESPVTPLAASTRFNLVWLAGDVAMSTEGLDNKQGEAVRGVQGGWEIAPRLGECAAHHHPTRSPPVPTQLLPQAPAAALGFLILFQL